MSFQYFQKAIKLLCFFIRTFGRGLEGLALPNFRVLFHQYSGTSLQRTCFIADTSLQRTLFLRTDEIMVKVSQKNLFIADRNSGHLSIADTTFGNQWQFCIEMDLCIADSHYQSKFITKLLYLCTNKNIIKAHLLNIKGQTDV